MRKRDAGVNVNGTGNGAMKRKADKAALMPSRAVAAQAAAVA